MKPRTGLGLRIRGSIAYTQPTVDVAADMHLTTGWREESANLWTKSYSNFQLVFVTKWVNLRNEGLSMRCRCFGKPNHLKGCVAQYCIDASGIYRIRGIDRIWFFVSVHCARRWSLFPLSTYYFLVISFIIYIIPVLSSFHCSIWIIPLALNESIFGSTLLVCLGFVYIRQTNSCLDRD